MCVCVCVCCCFSLHHDKIFFADVNLDVPPFNIFLTPGMPLLLEVSRHLGNEQKCWELAVYLLETSPGGGGVAFLERRTTPGGIVDWYLVAHEVLFHWCTMLLRQATSVHLWKVLRDKLHVSSAAACLSELISRDYQ